MRRLGLILMICGALAPLAHASSGPVARLSTTCSDFPNQAAAQRAHNTRDADGDGIYCEDLPCPCLKPGQGGGTQQPARPPSVFPGRCKRGILPDRLCSPGVVATTDVNRICTPGYSGTVRNVSEATKDAVYREYGIRRHSTGQYEVDHVVSLELGGSNSTRNLYPEAAAGTWGFHVKDKLENHLHALVCAGKVRIRSAQRAIRTNWIHAFKRFMGMAAG